MTTKNAIPAAVAIRASHTEAESAVKELQHETALGTREVVLTANDAQGYG